eukprot:7576129-Pyramimonas_sp.AAC.1
MFTVTFYCYTVLYLGGVSALRLVRHVPLREGLDHPLRRPLLPVQQCVRDFPLREHGHWPHCEHLNPHPNKN